MLYWPGHCECVYVTLFMKLEELLQQRDAYGEKIVKLMIQIALIFLAPILVMAGISYLFDIQFMYLFPVAFIISWTFVIRLYRRYAKEVRALDAQIKALRDQEKPDEDNTLSDTTSL